MYRSFVFVHLVGPGVFMFAHGASAIATFAVRTTRDPEVIGGLLLLLRLGELRTPIVTTPSR